MKALDQLKMTAFLRFFSFLKIPLLAWVRPSVVEMNDQVTILKLPLGRRTQNHLKVMYFGALAMGAEAAVALGAVTEIQKSGAKVDFIFKDFQANFLKRADGDVHFICEETAQVKALIQKALKTGVRENQTFRSFALVPSQSATEVVAEFKVTMSVKARSARPKP